MISTKQRVLFLCMGNSARSQMAEEILRKCAGDRFEVFSAGIEPKGVNPATILVMEEDGYNMSSHTSKSINQYLGKENFDYLITVCGGAEEKCPYFPGIAKRLHWPFEDPAAFQGSQDDILNKFRQVREQIKEKILTWQEDGEPAKIEFKVDFLT